MMYQSADDGFFLWLEEVSCEVDAMTDWLVCLDDLEDQPYHSWYTDGYSPQEAAVRSLENEGLLSIVPWYA